jgi:predicted Zn finger-like uncharacterized protein/prepilin-type processing-associated H-X9-DG protein
MPTQIKCPSCGQTYELTDAQVPQYAGQTINCTKCGKAFQVNLPVTAVGSIQPPPYEQQPHYPQPGYATPGFPQQQAGNGMAIAALVVGLISFCMPVIGSGLAILFGILGLRKTRDPSVGGKGLAIAGICLGGASLVMMPCMISILLPSLNRARETANRVKCASNMRQIGMALLLYSNENRGAYPERLEDLIRTQEIEPDKFVCPSSNDNPGVGAADLSSGGHLSYVYVGKGMTNAEPADTIILYENMSDHDQDGSNFLYGDGHVEFQRRAQAESIIAAVKRGENPPDQRRRGRN